MSDSEAEQDAQRAQEIAQRVRGALTAALPGLERAIDELLVVYMAGGHCLLEGVPGIGKTLLARGFAEALGQTFHRVQFTPDLMPSDVTGTNVFDPSAGAFHLVPGPIFTDVLMADEINRTPPKTQAALLEGMQERQVSIDGTSYPLSARFFVVATQNPLEFEGTYPLPEAQVDRFLLRVRMEPPAADSELELYRRAVRGELAGWRSDDQVVALRLDEGEADALRQASAAAHVEESVLGYLLQLATAVRESPHVELGPSPRGALSLLEAARGWAVLRGRDYVRPDDLKRLLEPGWGHRLLLSAESELEGFSAASVLQGVAATVPVPH